MIKDLVCVACPLGCPIKVTLDNNGIVTDVTGNTCKRGYEYAHTECTNPTRSLTSTVKVVGGKLPVVPVKSSAALPKGILFECMKVINTACLKAPVKIGDVVVKDILNTGIDIVATNEVKSY
ncbi:MAG: DUF1667 domain-containing protein [Oscillospiraceae bacterium]